jgi:hypothetical protein
MSLNTCPFCEQVNPADAKFCNACGGALHLVPCPRCGAVSDVTASTCYQCNGPLGGRGTGEAEPMPPAAEVPKPAPRRPRVMAGVAVLAAVAVLGYYGYRQSSPVEVPQPPPSRSEAAGDSAPAKADDAAQSESPAAPPPEMSLADRADQTPEESRRPNAAAGLIARPKAGAAGKAGRQAPPRQEVCTEAVAALGLCTMAPEERNLAEAVAAVKAAAASPEATEPGKAGPQVPQRQGECTEAVAALGLCTPAPPQRRE